MKKVLLPRGLVHHDKWHTIGPANILNVSLYNVWCVSTPQSVFIIFTKGDIYSKKKKKDLSTTNIC